MMCRAAGADTPGSIDVSKSREILPTNVVPKHYELTLECDFEKFTFEGTVVIDLDVAKDSTEISLNTLELDIHSTSIHVDGALVTSNPHLTYNEETQTTTIKFDKSLSKGQKAQLKQTFTGQLNDQMAGFYRASWKESGEQKYLAVSQFEPTDARRAFPCFDEPALKAEYTVTLIADKHMTCLSNMDVASETEVDSKITGRKRKAVKFNKSPVMSSYILAFIVGELKSISTDKFRQPISVWMTHDQNLEDGRFSLELAAETLAFYEKTFDSPYPMPKMDMVAVPDFSAGAMENWGLVTYRIVDVLLDEKTAGAAAKERVAEVVQHELAHQWFGNLVTMDFWDGLWLNEGFATWMSWYSCNEFYPEWKVWETFTIDTLQGALALDSLRSSHPIEVPVHRAEDINQIFDNISYAKGSAVLRMISKYLGEDVFLEGVRRYVKKHAWGNTQTGDLWAALSEASGKDVSNLMDIWTKHVGYPVITVSEDESKNTITLEQHRFLRTADVKPEEDKTLYPVILGLKTKSGIGKDLMLADRSTTITLPDLSFYKLNADHCSLFRTSYPPSRLLKLGEAAKSGLLTVEDRAGMIADAGALAASGYQKTSGILNLLKSFDTESAYIVWNEILTRINSVRSTWIFEDEDTKAALKRFQLQLCSAKAHELGWEFKENEDHILSQFKSLMFGSAGMAGDQKIIDAANAMFRKFQEGDLEVVHPNLKPAVFALALIHGGEKEYDTILARYHSAPTAEERNTCLRVLGRAKDPKLIQRTLELALSGEVKMQDVYMPISGLRAHKEGIEMRWHWMCSVWDELVKRLPPSGTMLSSVVGICAGGFTREEHRERVEGFFKTKDTKVCFYTLPIWLIWDVLLTDCVWHRDSIWRSIRPWIASRPRIAGWRGMGRMWEVG
jgi:aminopeptidase 2